MVCVVWAGVTIYPTVSTILLLCPRPVLGPGVFPDWLTLWSAARWDGAGWGPGARDFLTIGVHAPAEASAAVTLQRQEVALLIALRDVELGNGMSALGLGIALLALTGSQSRGGVFRDQSRGDTKEE